VTVTSVEMVKCRAAGCDVMFKARKGRFFCCQVCNNRTSYLENPKKWMYWRMVQRCQKNGQDFSLTVEDIPDIPEFCPVFPWVRLVLPTGKGRGYYPDAPSVDRIDSDLGYIPGNIRITSWRANTLKSDGNIREFEAIVADLRSR
jgi:hypothetical protein